MLQDMELRVQEALKVNSQWNNQRHVFDQATRDIKEQ